MLRRLLAHRRDSQPNFIRKYESREGVKGTLSRIDRILANSPVAELTEYRCHTHTHASIGDRLLQVTTSKCASKFPKPVEKPAPTWARPVISNERCVMSEAFRSCCLFGLRMLEVVSSEDEDDITSSDDEENEPVGSVEQQALVS